MTKKISSLQFESAMKELLSDYGDKVNEALRKAVVETGEDATDKLHNVGTFKGRKYKNSWTMEDESTATTTNVVVYNKKHYRLTHLLEFGHVKQNGGRTRAFPHIAPVNTYANALVLKKVKQKINEI